MQTQLFWETNGGLLILTSLFVPPMGWNLSAWSIRNPIPTIVLFLVLTIAGCGLGPVARTRHRHLYI
ncbi:efflux RND transporter permease subunit [Gloeobacter violaceus]|uniref:efflux RND transporter permease subunit n=1 Tax=Gloeobacter violaceus TaxID=33072 RepID=UPI0013E8D362|nr:efflux RND transporter permease subunit [Gloeobacter violaceus]